MRIRIRKKRVHAREVLRAELRRKVAGVDETKYLAQTKLDHQGRVPRDRLRRFEADIAGRLVVLRVDPAEAERLVAAVRPRLTEGGMLSTPSVTSVVQAQLQLVLARCRRPHPATKIDEESEG